MSLFTQAGMVRQTGFAPVGIYSARAIVWEFNQKRYEELKKLGVIA